MSDIPFPGTTRDRSDKALHRVRPDPVEPDGEDEEAWDAHPISVRTHDGIKECFKVGALARAWDDRTVASIYKLEQRGILPKPLYRMRAVPGKVKGDRLYTRAQIELIIKLAHEFKVYERRSRVRFHKTGFTQQLLQQWGGGSTVSSPSQEG